MRAGRFDAPTARQTGDPEPAAPAGSARRTAGVAALIFLGSSLVFWFSPNHDMADSQFTMLLATNLLRHGEFRLDRYHIPDSFVAHDLTVPQYRIERARGHDYYWYPPGSALLSVPYVAVMRLCGLSAVTPDGRYSQRGDHALDALLACALMALFTAVLFLAGRSLLPPTWSAVLAVSVAFGSQIYSTASRAMGSETWGSLLVMLALLLLLRFETERRAPGGFGFWLGTLAGWACIVRPTNALALTGLAIYLAIAHRRSLPGFFAAALIWLGLLVLYSLTTFGHLLPSYFLLNRFGEGSMALHLLGHLVSPSRGLLLYVPVAVVTLVVAASSWTAMRFRRLAWLALAMMAAHLLLVAYYRSWGGYCYGPRLLTGVMPWLGLLAILALDAWRRGTGRRLGPARLVAAAVICALGIGINAVGAASRAAVAWNYTPRDIDFHPGRIWDWRRPQFLAPFLRSDRPVSPIPADGILLWTEEASRYLGRGWSAPESAFRWTEGREATVAFAADEGATGALEIGFRPLVVRPRVVGQRVKISLNDRPLASLEARVPEFASHVVVLPGELLRPRNSLKLELPDAARPSEIGISNDNRLLGIAVDTIRWSFADSPGPILPIPADGVRMAAGEAADFMGAGWSGPEDDFRWTNARSASFRFALDGEATGALEIALRPYLLAGKVARQRVEVRLNGRRIDLIEVTAPYFASYVVRSPPDSLRPRNLLELVLPDATVPRELGASGDARRLGVAVRSLRWWSAPATSAVLPIPAGGIEMASPGAARYLGAGWSIAEGNFRWTDGRSATIRFAVTEGELPGALEISFRPYIVAGRVESQRVQARLNGELVEDLDTSVPVFAPHTISLPREYLRARNLLELRLPDAARPDPGAGDGRQLGIAVDHIRRSGPPVGAAR